MKSVCRFIGALALASAVLFAAPGVHAAAAKRPPNIVFILLDNIGREWFGCYGSEEHCTPHIDKLAAGGVRFENCYTPTVCGPSRVELLTGRYPFRTGWYLHHDAALYGGGGLDWKREKTFARVLRSAGYATGIAGKWQVNNLYDEPDALREHGFDEHLVWPGSIDRDKVPPGFLRRFQDLIAKQDSESLVKENRGIESRYWDPVLIRNGRRETHPGEFGPDLLQDFALDFIGRHADHPFLLYYPMVLAHGMNFTTPTVATPENRNAPPEDEKQRFAAMLRYADRQVGELVAALEKAGLRDNTCLFVASDNGTEKSLTARCGGREVRGGLYQINEAGGSVVLTVNSPALIPGGRSAPLADFTDVFPTICELAGAAIPAGTEIDGLSFAGFLRRTAPAPREWIFNEYLPDRVIRDAQFKLYSDGRFFDVNADPGEAHALAPEKGSDAFQAREKLKRLLNSMPADTPLPFPHRSLSAFKLRKGG